ncbi:MAG: hypothetical protein ACQGVC_18270 [Myxococcota bacterium]
MSLASSIAVRLEALLEGGLDLSDRNDDLDLSASIALATGTGAGQADQVFHDERTIAASGNEDLDLAGALSDPFGATLTFARIKAVLIVADTGNTNNVVITEPASNGVGLFEAGGDAIVLSPGGIFLWAAGAADATGKAVTASTGDLLNISNSGAGTGVTYKVVIIGASA